jgi:hypothetical protein
MSSQQNRTKEGASNPFFGKHHTEETRQKISNARRGQTAWNKGAKTGPAGKKTGGFNKESYCDYCQKTVTVANLERHQQSCPLNPSNIRLCRHCNKPIMTKLGHNQFYCSRSCHYAHKLANNSGRLKTCCICDKPFEIDPEKRGYFRKTCSEICLLKLIGQNSSANPNCGARAHFKGSHRPEYQGIQMDSSWEVSLARWLDRSNIAWIRSRSGYFRWVDQTGKNRRYTPDFYLPALNCYVDTKNEYLLKVDAFKLRQVRREHGITLIAGSLPYVQKKIKSLARKAE